MLRTKTRSSPPLSAYTGEGTFFTARLPFYLDAYQPLCSEEVMAEYVTRAKLARIAGVTPIMVTYAIRDGRFPTKRDSGPKEPSINIDDARVQQWIREQHAKAANGTKPRGLPNPNVPLPEAPANVAPEAGSKVDYEIKKMRAQTAKTLAELAQSVGKLIRRSEVEGYVGEIGAFLLNYLYTLGDRVVDEIQAVFEDSDPQKRLATVDIINRDAREAVATLKATLSRRIDGQRIYRDAGEAREVVGVPLHLGGGDEGRVGPTEEDESDDEGEDS